MSKDIRVIAETDEILALDKPAGLIVHSDGRTRESSLAAWIAKEYPELASVGESWISPQGEHVPLAGVVHRLDRTTSGIILVAKTQDAYTYLKNEFKERRVEKIYRAFVYGHMGAAEGKIVAEIARSSEPPKRWYARVCEEKDRRAAITEWRLLKHLTDPATGESVSYVEVQPKTGRTHQIRVHLASISHPIVADHIYAPDLHRESASDSKSQSFRAAERAPIFGFERPALHAYSISLILKGEKATFIAPLPDDFKHAGAEEVW